MKGPEPEDVVGKRFGRLVVVSEAARSEDHKGKMSVRWVNCVCDCGCSGKYRLSRLRSGHTASCGCIFMERAVGLSSTPECLAAVTKHGFSIGGRPTVPEYYVWVGMRNRCNNPKNTAWKDYGGRGITVCDRWNESFSDFYTDMGSRPGSDYSIDRVDNELGYSPENCRWATHTQQSNNRRNTKLYDWNGESLSIFQIARKVNMKPYVLMKQMKRFDMDLEKAISAPYNYHRKKLQEADL